VSESSGYDRARDHRQERHNGHADADDLTLARIMAIFTADLRRRRADFRMPSDPLTDTAWILMLQRIYADPIAAPVG